jgi:hypothetical protein
MKTLSRGATCASIASTLVCIALAGAAAAPAANAPLATAFTSFYVSVSAYTLSYSGTLEIHGFASYRDYDCTPSYSCDRNVMTEFTVHRGYSTYSPIVGRAYDETGQYSSSISASFRLPSCRLIPKYSSITYAIEMVADAPDGSEKTATTYAYYRSCR